MADKNVMVGILPEVIVIGPQDQVVWASDAGNLKIEFDPKRCPFLSNVFQTPAGVRLQSGTPRPGTAPGAYKYVVYLNDLRVGVGEVLLRER